MDENNKTIDENMKESLNENLGEIDESIKVIKEDNKKFIKM